MQLDRIAVALRPRSGWEALDLGFQMARQWWRPIWSTWFVVYLPAALLLHLVFASRPLFAVLALWWLKPVFDRAVLHVVSRAVFGEVPTVRETLASARDWLRPGWLAGLTRFRIDLARSFSLPVWQLEKQTRRDAAARRAALGRRMRGFAVWLTVVCAHFEAVVMFSLGRAADLLTPDSDAPGFDWGAFFASGETGWNWFDSLCYVAAVSAIEPFFVAAGFALYLNRRTILEGWDIELALRRLDERLRAAVKPGVAVALALVLVLLAAPLPPPAFAAEAGRSAKEVLHEVLQAPEFQEHRDEMTWRYRKAGEKPEARNGADLGWIANLSQFLGEILQGLGWVVVGILVLVALLWLRRFLPDFLERRDDAWRPPDVLFGLNVTPESLPDDIAAAATALAREGRGREALSLLYRGALSALVHRDHVPLAEGDTEGDVLRAARKALPAAGGSYFDGLVRQWQATAYGGRLPDSTRVEALAREWPPHFGRDRAEAPR